MLETAFSEVYTKFKLHFYRKVFERWESREATLTTVETFCMEIIYALDRPTVNEFASFVQISPPNAAYKVNSLIRKGYLKKVQSRRTSGNTAWCLPKNTATITISATITSIR